jgi:hypothetical protein
MKRRRRAAVAQGLAAVVMRRGAATVVRQTTRWEKSCAGGAGSARGRGQSECGRGSCGGARRKHVKTASV